MSYEAVICSAIQDQRVLEFLYKGKSRVVEPHALGITKKGKNILCAWQLSGASGVGWRDFEVAKISSLSVANARFAGPRAGYKRNDQTLQRIICQL